MNTEPTHHLIATSQSSTSSNFLADGFHFYTQHLNEQHYSRNNETMTTMETSERIPDYPPPSYEESVEANRQYQLISSMSQQQSSWKPSTSNNATNLIDNNDNFFRLSSNNNKNIATHHPMHHQQTPVELFHQGNGKIKQRGATRGRKAKQAKIPEDNCSMLSHHHHMETSDTHNNHGGNMRRMRRATTRLLLSPNNIVNLRHKQTDCAIDSMMMTNELSAGPSDRKYQTRNYSGLDEGDEDEENDPTDANNERMYDFERPKPEQHQENTIITNMLNSATNSTGEHERSNETSTAASDSCPPASGSSAFTACLFGDSKDIANASDQMSSNSVTTAIAPTTGSSSCQAEPMDPAHYYYPGASLSSSSIAPVGYYHHHHHQQARTQPSTPNGSRNYVESSYASPPLHSNVSLQCSTISPPSGSRAPQLGSDAQPLGGRSPSLIGRTSLEAQVTLGGECNNTTTTTTITNSAKTNRTPSTNPNITKVSVIACFKHKRDEQYQSNLII